MSLLPTDVPPVVGALRTNQPAQLRYWLTRIRDRVPDLAVALAQLPRTPSTGISPACREVLREFGAEELVR